MEFKNMSLEEFNRLYKVKATKEMDIESFTDYIESKEISYMYASYCENDVIEEYKDFLNDTEHECDLICVDGLYLALL